MVSGDKDTTLNCTNCIINTSIVIFIKSRRLEWAGHGTRIPQESSLQRQEKKSARGKVEGTTWTRTRLSWESMIGGPLLYTRTIGSKLSAMGSRYTIMMLCYVMLCYVARCAIFVIYRIVLALFDQNAYLMLFGSSSNFPFQFL